VALLSCAVAPHATELLNLCSGSVTVRWGIGNTAWDSLTLQPPIIECKLLSLSENANKQSKIRKIMKVLSEFDHLFQLGK